jgi:hypothetical protein
MRIKKDLMRDLQNFAFLFSLQFVRNKVLIVFHRFPWMQTAALTSKSFCTFILRSSSLFYLIQRFTSNIIDSSEATTITHSAKVTHP